MALSRLYPGFGSGKVPFEERYDCRSFTSAGRADLEASDKILLPLSAFKKVNQLRLPFPLTFRVSNTKAPVPVPARDGSVAPPAPEQFAGVLEFSAPEGVALLPQWMLQNLRLRDGGKALFSSVRDLPRGTYCRLQPHSQAFVDLAASVGPRDLLEVALRNYSALSVGERIMLDVADEKYFIDGAWCRASEGPREGAAGRRRARPRSRTPARHDPAFALSSFPCPRPLPPTTYRLLPTAYCLPPTAYCLDHSFTSPRPSPTLPA